MPVYDYDVIVAGAGLGGLSAAAVLSVKGAKVLVLEQGNEPGGYCRTLDSEGYRFDMGPSAFTGFAPGQPFNELLSSLEQDAWLGEGNIMRPLEPGPQLLLSGHRVTLYNEFARLIQELDREYPQCVKLLKRLYLSLWTAGEGNDKAKRGLWPGGLPLSSDLRAIRLLQRLRARRPVSEYLAALTLLVSPNSRSTAYTRDALKNLCSPFYLFKGGSSSLPRLLVHQITEHGGEIYYGAKVEDLLSEKGKVMGTVASLQSSQAQITAQTVILNTRSGNGMEWTDGNGRRAAIHDGATSGTLPFSLLLGVHESALPEQLSCFALAQLEGIDHPGAGNMVRLSLSPPWEEGWAPPKERTLKASIFLKGKADEDEKGNEFDRLTQSLLKALTGVIPFLQANITYMNRLTPQEYRRIYGPRNDNQSMAPSNGGILRRRRGTMKFPRGLHLVGAGSRGEYGAMAAVRSGLTAAKSLST